MDDYNDIYDEHEFYSHFAVCVNEGSGYYHSFKCSRFDKEENFKIYNISAAKETGLEPCPNCRTDEQ